MSLDVDALIGDPAIRIIVTCGAGGVGKTTTAAAIALRAAEQGRRVVVLTIDPARRLAQSMGLVELDNTPRPVADLDDSAGGGLDAMMLDMKRTFDDVVLAHASEEKARQILENPFYIALSSSFAGTQEYMAMEKLGQLHQQAIADGNWDLIVVDTPPSRSALDFLDAPERLASLLEGRFLKLLLAPARGPLKLMSAGINLAMGAMTKVLGAQVLRDVQTFAAAFETLFGGFRERAEQTVAVLREPHTAFLVVASPQNDALREASYFAERLRTEQMPLAGVVLNRVATSPVPGLSAERALAAAEQLDDSDELTAAVLRLHADRARQAAGERKRADRFRRGHRTVPIVEVPALADDIHDLDGLRVIGDLLSSGPAAPGSETSVTRRVG
jgi:anion-transporting  ArsA/GET3 family ATPase